MPVTMVRTYRGDVAVMRRTLLSVLSPTYRLLLVSMASARGEVKVAAVAAPSVAPLMPEPATKATTPEARVRLRTLKEPMSVIKRVSSSLLRATPKALLNLLMPSAPCTLPAEANWPATVVTTPACVTLRTVLPSPT